MYKTLLLLAAGMVAAAADDDRFTERFADPETREEALAELIPGTRDHFFHKALHHQLAGEPEAFEETVAAWRQAAERPENPISADGLATLENRRILLGYEGDPAKAAAELARRLDLTFNHARPDAAAAAAALPTTLDPAAVDEAAFEAAQEEAHEKAPYRGYRGSRLLRELAEVDQFPEDKLRWFSTHLPRADHPGVVAVVVRGLRLDPPIAFGSASLHERLTTSQLDEILGQVPELRANERFAELLLAKRMPGAEVDFGRMPEAHAQHLRHCAEFAATLPPALNSLKAHVFYHHLRLQAEMDRYPLMDFLAYLELPRPNGGGHRERRRTEPQADLGSNFAKATGCPPVRNDAELIEDYLLRLLADADDASMFEPYIEQDQLAKLHARARLLAGDGLSPWSEILGAAETKALQEETRIAVPRSAPRTFTSDHAVALPLDLKNTPELLVRIFEIDAPEYVRRHARQPDVEIDVDGLVPHHERRVEFAQPPLVLHRESIALPELDGAGIWLVEFVAGQVSARALVRKGSLTPYVERTADGQVVRVFDGNGEPVPGAVVSLGRETFRGEDNGRAFIPDAPNQPSTRGIVTAGKLAAPLELGPRDERLALDVRFHLDREQLLAGETATLQLRPRLTNHGRETSLERLENVALIVRAELLGGVNTERVIDRDLALSPALSVPFLVPEDLLSLEFTLRGTVSSRLGGEPESLEASTQYAMNGDLTSARIASAFFSLTQLGHRLELRGRNGEPLPSRAVTLELRREGFDKPVRHEMRTDEAGKIELGRLQGITSVTAGGSGISERVLDPGIRQVEPPTRIHAAAGDTIRLPLVDPAAEPDRLALSLLEQRSELPLRDHFDKIGIEENQLVIRDLPPGDHLLVQGRSETRILISSGIAHGDLLVSRTRMMPAIQPRATTVAAAELSDDHLTVRLRDAAPDSRVSFIGTRYLHWEWNPGNALRPFPAASGQIVTPPFHANGFMAGGRLSDEMRYILERRAAPKFPGSMLPRPGLLLHRWTEQEIEQDERSGRSGESGRAVPAYTAPSISEEYEPAERQRRGVGQHMAACDFLGVPSEVRFDLVPDRDGVVELPREAFEGSQSIAIVIAGPHGSETLHVPLPPSETPVRERRIARPLDPEAHHIATRRAAALAPGAEATIENLLDADWRAFTTLKEAHQFLHGMTGDERLRDFSFLAEWPELAEERKLELLAAHHCHEFHLFLARKDAAFFEKHVEPLLAEKPEPQFIDDLLLDRDLSAYLRPYLWKKLNAAEKALLAQALPEARERIATDLAQRWELQSPSAEAETMLFTATLRGSDLAEEDSLGLAALGSNWGDSESGRGIAYKQEKLRRIIIPSIDFENTTVEEAIEFLRQRSMELDTLELDPSRKGVNFVIRRPRGVSDDQLDEGLGGNLIGGDPGKLRIPELRLRNVPLGVALKYITDATRLRYKVDDYAITLVPQTETGEDLYTRTFRVPRRFNEIINSSGGTSASSTNVQEALLAAGISFAEGSSASMIGRSLVATNHPTELDKIEQLITFINDDLAEGISIDELVAQQKGAAVPSDPFTGRTLGAEGLPPLEPPDDGDPFAAPAAPPPPPARLFPDATRLWREANYYRNRSLDAASLASLNRFWLDLAAWDGEGPFLSPHFNACHTNANEALLCLALLDLPFSAERPEVSVDGTTLRVKAREPMLLFYKDTRRTDEVAPESPLLVRQSFHPLDEPFRMENGRRVENPVVGDFQPGVPYGASLVVTNPTGIGRRIEVLAQIPAGSIPLSGYPATLSSGHDLEPHGVLSLELAFYFPAAGDFPGYPLHVAEDGIVLAHSPPRTLRVSDAPAPQDPASWSVIARDGTNEQVLDHLRTANLHALSLDALLWRLKDRAFFEAVTSVLRERLTYSGPVASYGLFHNEPSVIASYLENHAFARRLGPWLDSPLLKIRPRVHHDWETLEFDPLINPRSHDFGEEPRFTHDEARGHYLAFLRQLHWKSELDAEDQLVFTAWLFLQDRIDEALARFDKIEPDDLPSPLRYDYLRAVALFHRGEPAAAAAIAAQRLPDLPPGTWRDRFSAVVSQADEIAALSRPDRKPEEVAEDPPAPSLELAMGADGRLRLKHQGLQSAALKLFEVDLEVLFSKDPFLQDGNNSGSTPLIRANEVRRVDLDASGTTTIDLPETVRRGNALLSAESANQRLLEIVDSQALDVRHLPAERAVQVIAPEDGTPLSRSYVKVYVEGHDGQVRFHKDGYTDLRGKFDYLSHTGTDVSGIRRLALLVSHPDKGARTLIFER